MTLPARIAQFRRSGAVVTTALLATALTAPLAGFGPAGIGSAAAQSRGQAGRPADQELDTIRDQQRRSIEAQQRLSTENSALADEKRKLSQSLIDSAALVRRTEEQIASTEVRLRELDARERDIRNSLEGRRSLIAEILAALQRIGRRPPPSVFVGTQDATESLRTAMSLEAVLPEMRRETNKLQSQLAELASVKTAREADHKKLTAELNDLARTKKTVESLIDERRTKQAEVEQAIAKERERGATLSRQANDLKDLIGKIDPGDSARRPPKRPNNAVAALNDPSSMGPAVAFVSAKGKLSLPVNGTKIKDFGTPDGTGTNDKGISIATRTGAQVTAPCDGWVVYAAPYRSYGQLLILNVGSGYHVLLAGMDRITVDPGQFVLTGEPVAMMGSGAQAAPAATPGSTSVVGSSQPVLYIEFRKDGTPIDSTPWWAEQQNEKVGG